MTGPAIICFHRPTSGMFVADHAELVGSTLTATGRFERRSTPNYRVAPELLGDTLCTRSWSMSEIRAVRWLLSPTGDVLEEAA